MRRNLGAGVLAVGCALLGCGPSVDSNTERVQRRQLPLEDVQVPASNMSLLVLRADTSVRRLSDRLRILGGRVVHELPAELLIAEVPEGVDAVLGDLGMVARYARAVEPSEVGVSSLAAERFVRLFSSRYYPEDVPPRERISPTGQPLQEGEPFEEPPAMSIAAQGSATLTGDPIADDELAQANERQVSTAYASGTVVVSLWLPESNGTAEDSVEDWSESLLLETQTKVLAALEAIARHEPNSQLRFVLHTESAPARGGLEGTVDTDWEYGVHARDGLATEIRAQLLSRVLGRPIDLSEYYLARLEYLADLRERYGADGVFAVYVAPNANGNASFRAYASINGPDTSVHTGYGTDVFMHEFGHIFGALDEYCPDQCRHPASLQGYFGMINANAVYVPGDPQGGIDNGQGEHQPSLMISNVMNGVNGYTRGAWGWLDTDGDGLLEALDTYPATHLTAELDGANLRVHGLIRDVPPTSNGMTAFSSNRIAALHYRFADVKDSPWLRVSIDGQTRGRETIDVSLGPIPPGEHQLEFRAENSVGNLQPAPQVVTIAGPQPERTSVNVPPHVALSVSPRVQSAGAEVRVSASVIDLDGDEVLVRYDLDGDGDFDTDLEPPGGRTFAPSEPGLLPITVEARDNAGNLATAATDVMVLDGDAPPTIALSNAPSPLVGSFAPSVELLATARDANGDATEINWRVELDDASREPPRIETGFREGNDSLSVALTTPLSLVEQSLDLERLLPDVPSRILQDAVLVGEEEIALALGEVGIAFVRAPRGRPPELITRLPLETTAEDLWVAGDRLYVLGGQLAVVDIGNPEAPHEIRQLRPSRHVRRAVDRVFYEIPEGAASKEGPVVEAPWKERIARAGVSVVVRHPHPEDLHLEMLRPREREGIILQAGATVCDPPRDPGPTPDPPRAGEDLAPEPGDCEETNAARPAADWHAVPGQRDVWIRHFTARNTPELEGLSGRFATDLWQLLTLDPKVDGVTGEVLRFGVRFDTEHRAAVVHAGASRLVGTLARDRVVVAGRGIEVLSARIPGSVRRTGYLPGTFVDSAALFEDHVLVASELEEKLEPPTLIETEPAISPREDPRVRGFYAAQIRDFGAPRVVRSEPVLARGLLLTGPRFYVQIFPEDPEQRKSWLEVGDAARFIGGGDAVLARHDDLFLSPEAFGDLSTLYNPLGQITQLDVTNPEDLRVVQTFVSPRVFSVRPLGSDRLVDLGRGMLVDLTQTRSIVSQAYRITAEARDPGRGQGDASRTVHVVPYDHAPTITDARVVSGRTTRDSFEVAVDVADPDGQPHWDPTLRVRADLDEDGIFEGPWQYVSLDFPYRAFLRFQEPGLHRLRFQARDGFYALSEVVELDVDVEPYIPLACTDTAGCPPGEYCHFEKADACGTAAEGTCELIPAECSIDETPVCGCDGVSYRNACVAQQQGVSPASDGLCAGTPTTCNRNDTCTGFGQYCHLETAEEPSLSCGDDGSLGECRFKPELCIIFRESDQDSAEDSIVAPPIGLPVCGCDDVTYRSACEAFREGVSIRKNEPCEPDCRTLGCPEGEECLACFIGFSCLPEGSVCIR